MAIDLPLVWAAIVGLAVAMYVILDGFDLVDRIHHDEHTQGRLRRSQRHRFTKSATHFTPQPRRRNRCPEVGVTSFIV